MATRNQSPQPAQNNARSYGMNSSRLSNFANAEMDANAPMPRTSQVSEQTNIMDENLAHLSKVISLLEDRLNAVLVSPDISKGEAGKVGEELVQLAANLQNKNALLNSNILQLESLLARIEL